jgi:DNA-binding GntR family transcriptional regulator
MYKEEGETGVVEGKRGYRGEEVYRLIKGKIITMELKPGTFVNERDLQDQLGIGRTPIREALLKLKGDNLVESSPNKSTYVKEITLKSVKDFFEPFVEMEKLIGRLAARRCDPAVLKEIRSAHRQTNTAIRESDFWQIFSCNRRLHSLLAKATDNEYIFQIHENLRNHAERLSYLAVSEELQDSQPLQQHLQKIKNQHEQILDCLERQDGEALERLMKDHVRLFQARISMYLQS